MQARCHVRSKREKIYLERCGNPKKKKIRRWGKPLIQVGGKKCIGEQGRRGEVQKIERK